MVIWKITTSKTEFYEKNSEAKAALREHREGKKRSDEDYGDGPEKVSVKSRAELAILLNEVSGN